MYINCTYICFLYSVFAAGIFDFGSYPACRCPAWRRPSHRASLWSGLWLSPLASSPPWAGLSYTPPKRAGNRRYRDKDTTTQHHSQTHSTPGQKTTFGSSWVDNAQNVNYSTTWHKLYPLNDCRVLNGNLKYVAADVRTILLLISWKWISHTFSTTSSFSKVTKPKPGRHTNRHFFQHWTSLVDILRSVTKNPKNPTTPDLSNYTGKSSLQTVYFHKHFTKFSIP